MKKLYNIKGFTLIEAMIALVVLSLGLLALGQFQGDLLKSSGETKAHSEGLIITQQKIEELREITTLTQLIQKDADGNYIDGSILVSGSDPDFQGQNAIYDTVWTIDKQPTGDDSALSVRIKVETSWDDAKGDAQDLVLYSYVAWDDLEISATEGDGSSSTGNTGKVIPQPSGSGEVIDATTLDLDSNGDGVIDSNDDTTGWSDNTMNPQTRDGEDITIYTRDNETVVSVGGEQVLYVIDSDVILLKGIVELGSGVPQSMGFDIVKAITSDAGVCPYVEGVDLQGTDLGLDDTTQAQFYCFVASDWFGNVGVLGEETSNGNPLLCSASINYVTNCAVLQAINNSADDVDGNPGANFNGVDLVDVTTLNINGVSIVDCGYATSDSPTIISGLPSEIIGQLPNQNFFLNDGGCQIADDANSSTQVNIVVDLDDSSLQTVLSVNGSSCSYSDDNTNNSRRIHVCTVSDSIADLISIDSVKKRVVTGNGANAVISYVNQTCTPAFSANFDNVDNDLNTTNFALIANGQYSGNYEMTGSNLTCIDEITPTL